MELQELIDGVEKEKKDILNKKLIQVLDEGKLDLVKYLVEQGADVNAVDDYNYNLINNASRNGYLDIVKYLHQNGGDVNFNNVIDEVGSITLASNNGHLDVVKYLHQNGADINNDINFASLKGYLDIVKYLVENGADVTNESIQNASYNGHLDVVKYLHQNGADIDKAIDWANPNFKEKLIEYKTSMEEKALLQSDLKEIKQEQKQKAVFKM